MTKQDYLNKVNEVNDYSMSYYKLNISKISDKDFDFLIKEIETYESAHPENIVEYSPTRKVGNDLIGDRNIIKHDVPMLSLQNTYNIQEVKSFFRRFEQFEEDKKQYVAELKLDGVSASLTYINGILKTAVTRGDGIVGEDITDNVKALKNVPIVLVGNNYPNILTVRGEIIISNKNFQKILDDPKEKDYSNPRNFVSGTIKSKSPQKCRNRNLEFLAYFNLSNHENHYKSLQELQSYGISTNPGVVITNTQQEVIDIISNITLFSNDYPCDGLVIKLNNKKIWKTLGETSKYPKWAFAYKFEAETGRSTVVDVEFQVGKFGTITPVGVLNPPVYLGGTRITSVTLHNFDFVDSLQLHVGDDINIERAGEVIPHVVSIAHISTGPLVTVPSSCPYCGAPTKREGPFAYCTNSACPEQKFQKLLHFVSKNAMNIKGIGPEILRKLIKDNIITDYTDFYATTKTDLQKSIGDRIGEKVYNNIQNSKSMPLDKVLYAACIPNIGKTASKLFIEKFRTIESILNASLDDLQNIEGIGPIIATSLIEFSSSKKATTLLKLLNTYNVGISVKPAKPQNNKLQGYKYVVTGTFKQFQPRRKLEDILIANGATISKGVSSKITAVIAGNSPGMSKINKANNLNIPILTEEQITHLL